MFTTLLLSAVLVTPVSPASTGVEVSFEASAVRVTGEPYLVEMSITAGGPIEAWRLNEAAFELDGKPLGERGKDTIAVPAGSKMTIAFDLGPYLPEEGSYQLGCAGAEAKVDVTTYTAVARGERNFLDMSAEELAKYSVLFVTNRGTILMEMWPELAPNHVRNFLDLSDSGFYEGVLFHRVSPSFMIQGGCPNTRDHPGDVRRWGTGNGPRRIPAEFSDTKHLPGILSTARSGDPDSASCQFFIMTAPAPSLDGQYSVFGKVVEGMDAVMKIANASGAVRLDAATVRPDEPQRIEHTYVLLSE